MQLRKKIILMYLDHLTRQTIIILSGESEKYVDRVINEYREKKDNNSL